MNDKEILSVLRVVMNTIKANYIANRTQKIILNNLNKICEELEGRTSDEKNRI